MTIYNVQRYEKFEKDDPLGDGMVLWQYEVKIQHPMTSGPTLFFVGQAMMGPAMLKFPIKDVSTVEEAFERFQSCAEAYAEVVKKQAREAATKQLLSNAGMQMPGGGNLPGKKNGRILGFNG